MLFKHLSYLMTPPFGLFNVPAYESLPFSLPSAMYVGEHKNYCLPGLQVGRREMIQWLDSGSPSYATGIC